MKTTHGQEIEFWEIRKRAGRRKPWELRWRVNASPKSRSFITKALAQHHHNRLFTAAREGEEFCERNGVPVSWLQSTTTVYELAIGYLRHVWATRSGNTRRTLADNLVRLVMASLPADAADNAPAPLAMVRSALLNHALRFRIEHAGGDATPRVLALAPAPDTAAACLAWVQHHSAPLSAVASREGARRLLERACVRLRDGHPCAPATMRRRRGVWLALLDHATDNGLLPANPLAGVRERRPRSTDAVNPRHVPDYHQAGRLLDAIATSDNATDRFLWAFFVIAYLCGTRPGETRALRAADIIWPENITDAEAVPGWGTLAASGSRTEVDASYTTTATPGEQRCLKARAEGDVRMIPLPPDAVAALRHHLNAYPTAPDGRLFHHPTTSDPYATLPGKVYRRTWHRARRAALTVAERELAVAQRPYDLRHGCASLLLAEGIPAPEIARRLGHTVEVLMTVYAHWFNHQEHTANRALDQAFRERGPLTGQPPTQPPTPPQNPRTRH